MGVPSKCFHNDRYWDFIHSLVGITARESSKILVAISPFTPSEVIEFADCEISRFTCMNFSKAWFNEEVKRLAIKCMECEQFCGSFGMCKNCLFDLSEGAFYNQKTTAQKVAEELGIKYRKI